MTPLDPKNLRLYAIATGLFFILLLATGPIGLMYMPEQIFNLADGAQTAQNLVSQSGLFFIGIGALVMIVLVEIVLCCLLYVLTRPVSQPIALMALAARLSMTVVIAMIIVPLLVAQQLAAATPTDGATQNLILALHQSNLAGTLIWQFIFALHLVLLGYLVFKSTYLPRLLGIALLIGGFGYLADSVGRMLGLMDIGTYAVISNSLLAAGGIGEVGLGLWLLIKGVHVDKFKAKALAA
ncbi:DUF4386 domain-containing protein [Maritalea mediterranea]|uniref:DUF4386 domain-containing protein n=1 Tax=Maritalea mediterranea TaxID=2909667 RepID=A0ABS9E9U6_9HYPH|nr:DUF4386 domain-containing protein [Maritalea mediterranea]MCF4099656.1 DUF4386 domain-containing protein [Maritalea mediterranea]